jgi:hypothetical protein
VIALEEVGPETYFISPTFFCSLPALRARAGPDSNKDKTGRGAIRDRFVEYCPSGFGRSQPVSSS